MVTDLIHAFRRTCGIRFFNVRFPLVNEGITSITIRKDYIEHCISLLLIQKLRPDKRSVLIINNKCAHIRPASVRYTIVMRNKLGRIRHIKGMVDGIIYTHSYVHCMIF